MRKGEIPNVKQLSVVNFVILKHEQALRALALLRLNRMEECRIQLHEVFLEEPSDEYTLQAMSMCYRELHRCKTIPRNILLCTSNIHLVCLNFFRH